MRVVVRQGFYCILFFSIIWPCNAWDDNNVAKKGSNYNDDVWMECSDWGGCAEWGATWKNTRSIQCSHRTESLEKSRHAFAIYTRNGISSAKVSIYGNRGRGGQVGLSVRLATGRSRVRIQLRKIFLLRNFGNSVYPALPVSFGGDTKSRRSLLSGVYARGSKRSHQSALEGVTAVDSTAQS